MGSLGGAHWKIEIRGTRENVSATADPQGKLLGVDLSGTSQAADYRLINEKELQKAQDTLKNVLGAKAQFMKISIHENGLSCYVLNPQKPTWQDNYRYDINGITKKNFIDMPAFKVFGEKSFSIDDIKLTATVKLLEKARTRVNMPDATVNYIIIEEEKMNFTGKNPPIIWSINLKKGANEGTVNYDNDGSETLVEKNGEVVFRKKKI